MAETKDEAKTQVERLVSEFHAEDMGTYMDARVDGKPIRVAVWNEGLKSYQPTDEGLALLAQPKVEPEKPKEKAKPAAQPTAQPPVPPLGPPAPPRPAG